VTDFLHFLLAFQQRAIHGGVSLLLLLLLVVEPNILHVVVRESTPWSPSDF
jgi:hypothetical protein